MSDVGMRRDFRTQQWPALGVTLARIHSFSTKQLQAQLAGIHAGVGIQTYDPTDDGGEKQNGTAPSISSLDALAARIPEVAPTTRPPRRHEGYGGGIVLGLGVDRVVIGIG